MKNWFFRFIGLFLLLGILPVVAQTTQVVPRKVVQFTGIIVSGDSAYGVPGVYVYVPKEGRGTMSNGVGYFSMAALTGDTILIKSLGYKEKSFIIPATVKRNYLLLLKSIKILFTCQP